MDKVKVGENFVLNGVKKKDKEREIDANNAGAQLKGRVPEIDASIIDACNFTCIAIFLYILTVKQCH